MTIFRNSKILDVALVSKQVELCEFKFELMLAMRILELKC